jgi:3-oxoacid CoA-transferase subunit B
VSGKEKIARRIAREVRDGFYVNLGIGLPTMIASYLPAGLDVVFQSENGMLGVGPPPREEEADPELINAGKQPVTELPGCCYFASEESFAMIRGGHMDMSVLGAMQVDEEGNLANWTVPGKMVKGMGGAMDLVAGARRVIVAMEHQTKDGAPKILRHCTLPLTGMHVVHDIVTEIAWIKVTPEGLLLTEIVEGISPAEVQARTEARLIFANDISTMTVN